MHRLLDHLPRNLRIVGVLAVTQAACLVLGLWLQDRFIVAAAEWTYLHEPVESAAQADIDANRINVPSEILLESMFSGRLLGFVWICGMQSVVAYLLLTRTLTQHDTDEKLSHEETLLKTKELIRTRDAVIFGLAKLAESRDPDTGHHLERIAMYSTRLASSLRRDPRYRGIVTPMFVRTIGISSALHDIGKVGVADRVLLKPGRLEREERDHMQTHTTLGGECIHQIEQQLGNSNFLAMARQIAFCHHERWDGEGYPVGLWGEEIPLAARIVAIADVYDALSSRRVYKEPYSHEKCVEMIRREAGQQFDPDLVDVFLKIEGQFREISQRFTEPEVDFIAHAEIDADRGTAVECLPWDNQAHPSAVKTAPGAANQVMTAEQEQLLSGTINLPAADVAK
jgi:putative two-component system response regulator